jgi:predicted TIM-barrel fold metal-dependent hydrolase
MTRTYELISSDSHVTEPHHIWRDYADRKLIAELRAGLTGDDAALTARLFDAEDDPDAGRFAEVYQGGHDPHQRVKDLEIDGVDAEILFPTTGMGFYTVEDHRLRGALFRAYNDWLSEFCSTYPDQFKGIGMINHDTIDDAVSEAERCKSLGMAGLMIPLFPGQEVQYHDRALDPFWAKAVELAMPVNLHSSTFREKSNQVFSQPFFSTRMLNTPYQIQKVLLDLVFSGVFDRHPDLRLVSAENDAGWAGFMLERGDYWWDRYQEGWAPMLEGLVPSGEVVCQHPPSYYFHSNIKLTFMRDRTAVLSRDVIGREALMWGNDFPHHITTWPNSQKLVDEYRQYMDPDDVRRVFCTNVREIYGF